MSCRFTDIVNGVFAELVESHVKQRLFELHRVWMNEIAEHIETFGRCSAGRRIAKRELLLTRNTIQH